MKRAKNLLALCTVIWMLSAVAGRAEQAPPKADAGTPAPEAAPQGTASEASTIPPALAEALAKVRDKAESDRLKVGEISEVKHYKQETLQGFGLVLDLEEIVSARETTREEEPAPAATIGLAELVKLLNSPVGEGDSSILEKLRDAGQLTLVAVTAVIPPEGVRKGDRVDCEVKALDGKSLENTYLLNTQLATPGPREQGPMAVAAGPVVSSGSYRGGPAKVASGCLVETDICDQFIKDDKVTLILDEEHADFLVAQEIVNLINADLGVLIKQPLAKALNRFNVEVTVPQQFAEDPVAFVTMILQLETDIPAPEEEEGTLTRTRGRLP